MRILFTVLFLFISLSVLKSQNVSIDIVHICESGLTGQISISVDSDIFDEYPGPYYIEWENLDTGDWGEENFVINGNSDGVISIGDLLAGNYEIIIEVSEECYILVEEEVFDLNIIGNGFSLIQLNHATCTVIEDFQEVVGVGGLIVIESPFFSPLDCRWYFEEPEGSLQFVGNGFLIDDLSAGKYILKVQDNDCFDFEEDFNT